VSYPTAALPAAAAGTFTLGGDLVVNRLGFGAMRITGPGTWGPPADPAEAIRTLRRAVELGVNLIDTADSYGPHVSEELVNKALHPYHGLTIATKGGFTRPGPGKWSEDGRPEHLRRAAEGSLVRLGVETIDLYQLHRIDRRVPMRDQIWTLLELQKEGKIRHIGLSEVDIEQIVAVRELAEVASVQNRYNLSDRRWDRVVDYCEAEGLGFLPWFPLARGELANPGGALVAVAARTGATPVQVAIAWLLRRSPAMLPIPGTGSVTHLEENLGAGKVVLSDEDFEHLNAVEHLP
jgi:aryl-alcohol dehydrogenase-like predicted oxidoreductase